MITTIYNTKHCITEIHTLSEAIISLLSKYGVDYDTSEYEVKMTEQEETLKSYEKTIRKALWLGVIDIGYLSGTSSRVYE